MAAPRPYFRPSLPFTGAIYGGLKDGMMALICGSVLRHCNRFQIDFQCETGQSSRPDIALHFNARFNENCVVSNSLETGKWGKEERKQEMPFRKGHPFEIRILVNSSCYMVAVDGKHLLEFKHRIPLYRVDAIAISEGLEVSSISFQGPTSLTFPSYPVFPPNQSFSPFPAFPPNPVFPSSFQPNTAFPPGPFFPQQSYPVPFQTAIAGGLYPSKAVTLSGTVCPNATRFHVNLKAGSNTALHLNPRFNENVIVRNSKVNGHWGSEERHMPAGMPLSCGQTFTIWIMCNERCFKVYVNGQDQFDYNYRFPNLQQINCLEIEGDVTLSRVEP